MIFGLQKIRFPRQDFELTDRQTEDKLPWRTPLSRRKNVVRGGARAQFPHSNKLSASGAGKMEYFITFPASALVWKALLGAFSEHFWAHSPPPGAHSGPRPGGYPPFGLVFGLNCQQSSARKAPPVGRGDARLWKSKVVLGELWSSATRRFFRTPELAVLARQWAK